MAGQVPKGEVVEATGDETSSDQKLGIETDKSLSAPGSFDPFGTDTDKSRAAPGSFDPFNSFDITSVPPTAAMLQMEEDQQEEAPWVPTRLMGKKKVPTAQPAYVTTGRNDKDFDRLAGEKDGLQAENTRLAAENTLLMKHCTEAAASATMAAQWASMAGQQQSMFPQAMPFPGQMPFPGMAVPGQMPFPGLWGLPAWGMQMPIPQAPAKQHKQKQHKQTPAATKGKKQVHADAKTQPSAEKTTAVLRNTPTDYTRTRLVELLDAQGFAGSFDFVYVPFDFEFNKSVGFAFVNLTSAEIAEQFMAKFEGFKDWGSQGEWKDATCNWASPHQGFDAHVRHFRNSPVMHESVPDEQKPAIFKNGKRVPFSVPTQKLRAPRMRPGHVAGRRNQFAPEKEEHHKQGEQEP